MANRVAVYRQQQFLEKVEHWWEYATTTEGKVFDNADSMFEDYVEHFMRKDLDYEAIMSMGDFLRCVYKIGVRRLGDGTAASRDFVRANNWRPSDNQTMRFTARAWGYSL